MVAARANPRGRPRGKPAQTVGFEPFTGGVHLHSFTVRPDADKSGTDNQPLTTDNLKDNRHSRHIARLPSLVYRHRRYNRHLLTVQLCEEYHLGYFPTWTLALTAYNSLAFQDGPAELNLGNLSP